jgi:hypothetical protein
MEGMKMIDMNELLTTADLARRWRISVKTATARLATIPGAFRPAGTKGNWRVFLRDVVAYENRPFLPLAAPLPSQRPAKRQKLTRTEIWQRHCRKHPERAKARALAASAIRRGLIVRQPCEYCGGPKAEAHHADYAKPLQLNWRCRKCHQFKHRVDQQPTYAENI